MYGVVLVIHDPMYTHQWHNLVLCSYSTHCHCYCCATQLVACQTCQTKHQWLSLGIFSDQGAWVKFVSRDALIVRNRPRLIITQGMLFLLFLFVVCRCVWLRYFVQACTAPFKSAFSVIADAGVVRQEPERSLGDQPTLDIISETHHAFLQFNLSFDFMNSMRSHLLSSHNLLSVTPAYASAQCHCYPHCVSTPVTTTTVATTTLITIIESEQESDQVEVWPD